MQVYMLNKYSKDLHEVYVIKSICIHNVFFMIGVLQILPGYNSKLPFSLLAL